MQMYRIKFAHALAGDRVDMGDVVVCARDENSARDSVRAILALPQSGVEMDSHRVKPSLYQISRETVHNKISAIEGRAVDAALASTGTFPGVTESIPDKHWFTASAMADVLATDDDAAISVLVDSIAREMSGKQKKNNVCELQVNATRTDAHARSPAIEQNAIYTVHRIFAGGAARGK